ncbi:type 1 glutamine amidotransferase domain-containing protein [Fervidicoccus fontis]|uniref:Peptidase, family C56 n=1 Tax=Fervidicoccus fontis (strain DSM 19380 / JCM 18336 / VKM B-2539 / Kam940) TaxID=1163730 RepID=H9ZZR4_FERFK|nr:type 1 glutamine amidotransferase domain-containing protein [Fervidicoccus fontis]AFH42221.1 peptidase, family C56 [Fervidicoccus fontis Kam940]
MKRKALILIGPEFEDIEALYPYYRLIEAGFDVTVAAPFSGEVEGKHGYRMNSKAIKDINPDDFDILVLPGGRGPERIRVSARDDAVRIVKSFYDSGKPIAAICHGPQLLLSAGIVKDIKLTSYPGIADDLKAGGAEWLNEKVVVHGNIITSRLPEDLPYWMEALLKALSNS